MRSVWTIECRVEKHLGWCNQAKAEINPLTVSFLHRNSIPGPDHLSTLSTTIELLQLLLPEDTAVVLPEQDDEGLEGESLKRTNEISISAVQMRNFLKFNSSTEDGPLKTLEKRLEVWVNCVLEEQEEARRFYRSLVFLCSNPVLTSNWCFDRFSGVGLSSTHHPKSWCTHLFLLRFLSES